MGSLQLDHENICCWLALLRGGLYRRRLPHWHSIGQTLFVTFRLHDSLPPGRVFTNESMTSGEAFAAMDRLLDQARSGPMYLKDARIAALMVASIRRGRA